MITVFTPTYNRAYIITKLYASLQEQTCRDFEWLVVDDGSTDNTEQLFKIWLKESDLKIRYIKQENGGKHRAINKGVIEAKGEWFFIVDSDDYVPKDSIALISKHIEKVQSDLTIAGVCGMRYYPNGERVGGNVEFNEYLCNAFEFRYKYHVRGDLAEVFRVSVLKQYPFPEIEGEKFCPEALVWNAISSKFKILYFNKNTYVCEYLSDGLSASSLRHRIHSPIGSMLTYRDYYYYPMPLWVKFKAAISFWRFYFHSSGFSRRKIKVLPRIFSIPGYLFYLKDKHLVKN